MSKPTPSSRCAATRCRPSYRSAHSLREPASGRRCERSEPPGRRPPAGRVQPSTAAASAITSSAVVAPQPRPLEADRGRQPGPGRARRVDVHEQRPEPADRWFCVSAGGADHRPARARRPRRLAHPGRASRVAASSWTDPVVQRAGNPPAFRSEASNARGNTPAVVLRVALAAAAGTTGRASNSTSISRLLLMIPAKPRHNWPLLRVPCVVAEVGLEQQRIADGATPAGTPRAVAAIAFEGVLGWVVARGVDADGGGENAPRASPSSGKSARSGGIRPNRRSPLGSTA